MRQPKRKVYVGMLCVWVSLFVFGTYPALHVFADDLNSSHQAEYAKFELLKKRFSIPAPPSKTISKGEAFFNNDIVHQFSDTVKIFGLDISGSVHLNSEFSMVRVILVREDLHEDLVYEVNPLLVDQPEFSINRVCEETCVLESITPQSLRVELVDASLQIDDIAFIDSPFSAAMNISSVQMQIKSTQDAAKVKKINNHIQKNGLQWIAGETSVSRLSYEDKKKLFSRNKVPNLQGAEYYKSGVFEIKSEKQGQSEPVEGGSSLIESFDWRNRHGADDPESPYYDGNPKGGGWLTPVQEQDCNHCWVFSPVHATEAMVNLYFNQHLDLNLSEQDVGSCSGGEIGCCSGGYISTALDYIINTGVVDEDCFPYARICGSCYQKCTSPNDRIQFSGKQYPGYYEQDIKQAVIEHGPITCGIDSWWHFMVLVGFDKDPDNGKTIWIFKNSWGTGWGENGYGYIVVNISDLYGKYALLPPVVSLFPYQIACHDFDGDGYLNWGLSEIKPSSCPDTPAVKDCDDSNIKLGAMDSNGHCLPNIFGLTADFGRNNCNSGTPCVADFNNDNDVDGGDLVAFLAISN